MHRADKQTDNGEAMKTDRLIAAAILVMAAASAAAHEFQAGAVTVAHPWARASVAGGTTGAVFLEIKASAGRGDRLVGGKTDAEYLEVKTEDGATRRCYLMEGVGLLFPSGFPEGAKVTLAGTYRSEVINRDDPDAQPVAVFRDCVPLQRDPKAK